MDNAVSDQGSTKPAQKNAKPKNKKQKSKPAHSLRTAISKSQQAMSTDSSLASEKKFSKQPAKSRHSTSASSKSQPGKRPAFKSEAKQAKSSFISDDFFEQSEQLDSDMQDANASETKQPVQHKESVQQPASDNSDSAMSAVASSDSQSVSSKPAQNNGTAEKKKRPGSAKRKRSQAIANTTAVATDAAETVSDLYDTEAMMFQKKKLKTEHLQSKRIKL
jgi:hypothetical protein